MRRVVSVSLGSARRDHKIVVDFLGEMFEIARVGTDGDFDRALGLIRELDGQVDAIGLGGIDVYLYVRGKQYAIRDGLKLMEAAEITPVVDGSGLKNTLEREAVRFLAKETGILNKGTKVLMVSSVDRFGMAEAMSEMGCEVTYGDLIFAAGMPYPIKTVEELEELAGRLLPEIAKMPFQMIYPTGRKQEEQDLVKVQKLAHYYHDNEVIAGDFHFIRRFMPEGMTGQTVLTNTTTADDLDFLRGKGVGKLITTTPEYGGRSFGTNVIEAVLVSIVGKPWREIAPEDYLEMLGRLNFQPRIVEL